MGRLTSTSPTKRTSAAFITGCCVGAGKGGSLNWILVVGTWVEEHIRALDQLHIRGLKDVLDLESPDLWKWLTTKSKHQKQSRTVLDSISNIKNYVKSTQPCCTRGPSKSWSAMGKRMGR
ncbi:TPR repeat region family protein [Musa troglodytarum]|uniref:TPR repeat region family protein n=1 Tax=Musa troglodytarum TaxID=320322 RepID=A0A9E7JKX5_9LILI|nr:TPR repeat region family protein [Musa troglodytarum]